MLDIEDERTNVVDSAIKYNLGGRDEIELYEHLSVALELMEEEKFDILESSIKNGINFHIITRYPDGLPEKVGMLFFNIDSRFDVSCVETDNADAENKIFSIKIKKR